jgi:protein TonB
MNAGLKRERLYTLISSFVFSSFSAVAVALLFSRLTLYSLPETPQQVVEVISLPILEQKPQSPPEQRKVERQAQREPKRERIERKIQEKSPQSPQQPPKAQEQKIKEEPKREIPVQESPVAQEVKPLATQEAGTRETPREEKRIIGGEAHAQKEAPRSGEAQRQEVATRERVENPPQVQEKKPTLSPPADQLSRYFALVKGIIESKKRYPEEAKRRGEEGTVVVSFTIDESGNPVNVRLASSSGSSSIDNETLRLIRSLKFPPPPDGKPLNLRVEVEYQLRR